MSVLRATLGVVRVANAADKLSLPCTFRIQRVELGFGTTAPVRRLSGKYDCNRCWTGFAVAGFSPSPGWERLGRPNRVVRREMFPCRNFIIRGLCRVMLCSGSAAADTLPSVVHSKQITSV